MHSELAGPQSYRFFFFFAGGAEGPTLHVGGRAAPSSTHNACLSNDSPTILAEVQLFISGVSSDCGLEVKECLIDVFCTQRQELHLSFLCMWMGKNEALAVCQLNLTQ